MADDLLPVCGECGKIEGGPMKGQHVPNWPADATGAGQRDVPTEYKGQQITHTTCRDCYKKQMRARYGHRWFRRLGKQSEDE